MAEGVNWEGGTQVGGKHPPTHPITHTHTPARAHTYTHSRTRTHAHALAVCAGLAGEASDLPTNFARPTHHTHAPATSHTTNSASTQPACVPSATTSSDGTIGVASLQGAPVSRAAAAVGAEGGKPDGGGGVRPTRVGTRAQQQQRVHEQQQQQQRGKKRANTCDEGQVAVAPAPRDTRAAAAGG
eukprot:scaffold6726_cov18-Tisochrysis_lutea.AAC.2